MTLLAYFTRDRRHCRRQFFRTTRVIVLHYIVTCRLYSYYRIVTCILLYTVMRFVISFNKVLCMYVRMGQLAEVKHTHS